MASLSRNAINKVCCYAHPDAALEEDYRAGDQIYSECGLVVEDRVIDVGSEWSNEKSGVDPSHVGGPENPFLNADLSTMIGPGTGAASFNDFGTAKYQNQRTMSSSDRNLLNTFREITDLADHINVPKTIVDRANTLLKQIYYVKHLRCYTNKYRHMVASTCFYIACRQENEPRTFKEICAVNKLTVRKINRCFKLILKTLKISNVNIIPVDNFISRFCSNLRLPNMVQRVATHIARKVKTDIVSGRKPISVAAAAIYMASQASEDKRSQKEISNIVGVRKDTIQQTYKLMYPHANKLFPEDFRFATPIDQLPWM